MITHLVKLGYFISIVLFIFGLKRMSSPVTARNGIIWAGVGMAVGTFVTFFMPNMSNYLLMLLAIIIGSVFAWYAGEKVKMTDMPQMIALFNGLGGGSAAAISAVEMIRLAGSGDKPEFTGVVVAISILGALIGAVSFSGSLVAFAKLQEWQKKAIRFPKQHIINLALLVLALVLGISLLFHPSIAITVIFFIVAILLGLDLTFPIGGADMPVVISLYNALTGVAVAAEGFVLQNPAMIIAGTVVGAAGTMLTQAMAKAMNRPITNILFSNFGETVVEGSGEGIQGIMKPIEITDAAVMLEYAEKVIIVPGYGMAVAQAQHKVWELTKLLLAKNISVKFAIHPVAGRMPGHMNVLLAEAGVPYDLICDLEEINSDFANTDVTIIIGANDVVNPDARTNKNSPIYGMPILNADQSKQVLAIKRGKGTGFSGIENAIFFKDNTRMLFGDAQGVMGKLAQGLKEF